MTSCLGVSKNPKHQLSGFKKRCDSLNSSGVALVLFLVLKKVPVRIPNIGMCLAKNPGTRPAKR